MALHQWKTLKNEMWNTSFKSTIWLFSFLHPIDRDNKDSS